MIGSFFASQSKMRKEPEGKGGMKLTLDIKHHFNKNLVRRI